MVYPIGTTYLIRVSLRIVYLYFEFGCVYPHSSLQVLDLCCLVAYLSGSGDASCRRTDMAILSPGILLVDPCVFCLFHLGSNTCTLVWPCVIRGWASKCSTFAACVAFATPLCYSARESFVLFHFGWITCISGIRPLQLFVFSARLC